MALITWTEDQYGTKVAFADEEHKVLFGLLNKLYDDATGGAERSVIGASLDALLSAEIFARSGQIQQVRVRIPESSLNPE